MSKKSNPTSLQLIKNKQWPSKSFFENYNYSKLLYQDLYIQNYIENFFKYNVYGSIIHNISIQRKGFQLFIFIDYYQTQSFGKKSFGNTKKFRKKAVRIKKKFKWSNKKKIYMLIKKDNRARVNPLQRYLNRRLELFPDKYGKRLFALVKRNRSTSLAVFSLKRLLILNLIFLTKCLVRVRVRNVARLLRLPFYKRKVKHPVLQRYYKKYVISVRDIMYKLRIKGNVSNLSEFNVPSFVHLFYTSLVFKDPKLVGVFLSNVLKRNIKVFYIFYNFLSRVVSSIFVFSSLNGLKIQFKGRLGTSLRKRTSSIVLGTMPLQTLDSSIKYSFTESMTVYGVCSIKIWYYY